MGTIQSHPSRRGGGPYMQGEAVSRRRVLVSAYACEPGKGSEPGVGWHIAIRLARFHDVWVLTRANNRAAIEAEMLSNPVSGLQFVYFDLPAWARFWKRGGRGVQAYYYLWQLAALPMLLRLHERIGFDVAHHLTFGKYWAPAATAFLPVPSVLGPVGGGDSTPEAFLGDLSPAARRYERARSAARWLGERDPLVRWTVRRSSVCLAKTEATAVRLRRMGAKSVQVLSEVAFPSSPALVEPAKREQGGEGTRFISVGNLLGLKGFHLGIRAFARADVRSSKYWIVGDGPERENLKGLARTLGVEDRVLFTGRVARGEALRLMAQSDVLVHPSLHDASGWVCPEAMALGKPVVCLDLGGPALQVTSETGIKVAAISPNQAVCDIADAMQVLTSREELRRMLGVAGLRRFRDEFDLGAKVDALNRVLSYEMNRY